MLVLVIVLQVLLFRSRWGLRTRAVGEHPKAAETVGIDVIRLRYRNVILGGVFAGLAGAWLTLESSGSFQNGMTDGRGFIALAALIFGRWTPLGAFGAALLFAVSEALGPAIGPRPPTGQLGDILRPIPEQFFGALPYIVTIVVLAGVVGRSIAPAADRPAVRARSQRPETGDRRRGPRRASAPRLRRQILDLQEGRGPVPFLDEAALEPALRATRRIAVVGASSNPFRPSFGVFRYLLRAGLRVRAGQPDRARRARRCRPFRRWPRRPTRPARSTSSTCSGAPSCACRHAEEAVAAGARLLWLQLGVVNWEAARIAHEAGLRS